MGTNVQIQPPVPRLTGQESEAMAERNLEVLERIDGGSFSDVFKVKCLFDNKKFALKRICIGKFVQLTKTSGNVGTGWEYFGKLLREVNNMAQLEHPNIVAYNEAWFEGPLRKMFSEWLRFKMTNEMASPPLPTSNLSATVIYTSFFL
jgi:serine/threonine protein kinase